MEDKARLRRLGFACQVVAVPNMSLSSCTLAKASPEYLQELISRNLEVLEGMLGYCQKQGIGLFRISSDIIPFASHPAIKFDWRGRFKEELAKIGQMARRAEIRVSMHPGQYTVLNSPLPLVVERAVEDLQYHTDFLDALEVDDSAKIILHIGGVYGERAQALARFISVARTLPERILRRLVLENDDRCFAIDEVYSVAQKLSLPVVFDFLHHALLPAAEGSALDWLNVCAGTWQNRDGRQKVHYSQQLFGGKPGSHSKTIDTVEFLRWEADLPPRELDIMLEVKDKNLSAVKCMLCLQQNAPISLLREEWARYKYLVLAHSQKIYLDIRRLLNHSAVVPADFYRLCDLALAQPASIANEINAAEHVWGYFKDKATAGEKKQFLQKSREMAEGKVAPLLMRRFLCRLARKYSTAYLLNSIYCYWDE